METNPSSSSSSSYSLSSPAKKYDVFLSFRGDTRSNFTSHLDYALRKVGLFSIFKDDYKLPKGKDIETELMNAIEDSHFAVVVISEKYADSDWCLKELAKIVKCMGDSGRIRTIFYHVNLSHVRDVASTDAEKQKDNSFWKALEQHAKDPSHSKYVESWTSALVEVAYKYADYVKRDTDEAIFIKEFVAKISSELGASIRTIEGLFGMTSRLIKLDSYVLKSLDTNNVCFIGIHGMGGIGKSSLAEVYHMKMSHKFDGSCFLANIREVCEKEANGLVGLQNKLLNVILGEDFQVEHLKKGINLIRSRLRAMKVLIILDDVNNLKQLEALVDSHKKKQGSENELDIWFGPGSVIIVTTRNEDLLTKRYEKYGAECLDKNEALQLFSWKAFESIEPLEEFKMLSEKVVKYARNLPLALTVLGSLLGPKKTVDLWNSALCRLKKCPADDIFGRLRISFDDLDKVDQSVFLDIACFFKGRRKHDVIEILDSCGFDSQYGISNLVGKSLLSINEVDEIWMHDLLEEMGKDIVRRASGNELGRQSRIWNSDELYQILQNKEGTDEVEAIFTTSVVSFGLTTEVVRSYSVEGWSFMKKLRLIKIQDILLPWLGDCDEPELSNNLQYIYWAGFPCNKLPSSFQPPKLVHLELPRSKVKQLWENRIKPLCNLKVIDLRDSPLFTKFGDFTVVPNLEKLILSDCSGLSEIDPSINCLHKLILLQLNGCISLQKLPEDINGLASLQTLNLYKCHRIKKLPNHLEQLKSLRDLKIDEETIASAIREEIISYGSTGKIGFYPGWFYTSLTVLFLSDGDLTGPEAFPEYFGKLVSLSRLYLSNNPFSVLPPGIDGLSRLTSLSLDHCKNLRCLEAELLPSSLEELDVNYCTSLTSFLDPLKPCHLRCSAYCLDCTELVKKQDGEMTALASITRFLEDPSKRRKKDFKFVVPESGNELPSWFNNRSSTASVSIKLDPNWRNRELIGFAMVICLRANFSKNYFFWNIRVRGSENWETVKAGSMECRMSDDHLFLVYAPCEDTLERIMKQLKPPICDTLEFSFVDAYDERSFSFGACGVRLVYEEDIEELKEIASKYYNDQHSSHSQSISQLSMLRHMGQIESPLSTGLRGILNLEDNSELLEMQQYADEDGPHPESDPSMVGNTHYGVFRNCSGITTNFLKKSVDWFRFIEESEEFE
ncbi:hypothetical protein FNV43_RR08385 [Rhamnella rubrinervis]|uniref:ADP-ribosyl cyclase/cyclic ADP-ribose hydrolase n=1 Tax=Rhamnella rubrinervis TaxID=2594499 RepID=A0A8K0MJ14_9ROSA|nr:hypothetical protein FNV43_RR08385 [Rhamnella rubrinervis]